MRSSAKNLDGVNKLLAPAKKIYRAGKEGYGIPLGFSARHAACSLIVLGQHGQG